LQKLLTSVLGSTIILMQRKLVKGGRTMDKDEILKKAQAEKHDEREVQVKDKSMMWSYIVMVLVAAIFSFIRSEQGLPMMDLTATVSASVCAAMTYRFIKTKDKSYLLVALVSLCVAIIATVRFFMGH
jgi:cell division GTPase FtsZ